MKIIEKEFLIHAPAFSVWRALTSAEDIAKWSGTAATMDDKEGTEFKLWNGDIYGKNLEVTENDELVQEWFGGKWDTPSKVTFTLIENGNNTKVHLLHEGVPDDDYEEIETGWSEYYMDPLKEYVESELV